MREDSAAELPTPTAGRWSFISSSHEPDFVLGPLALLAVAALFRAARQRKRLPLLLATGALALEFGWPTYNRFKRKPGAPTLLAHYPED
jgi:hypothetical protein